MTILPDWLEPPWGGRQFPGIGAVMTTRAGGMSRGPYTGLNLRHGVGDDPAAVAANQARFAAAIGATPVWLDQVHGTRVLRLESPAPGALPPADASISKVPGIACTVQVADCLPVLFAAPAAGAARGQGAGAVGAAHAGWRGLAAGVLEATLAAVCDAACCRPGEVSAWLGACIGPRRFEVGDDVLRAFGVEPALAGPGAHASLGTAGDSAAATPAMDAPRAFRPHAPGKWLADLPLLARERLLAAGVRDVSGGGWCTVEDASRFFSFRRDGITGRMAAAVWIEPRRG